jgi:hypothetical protein
MEHARVSSERRKWYHTPAADRRREELAGWLCRIFTPDACYRGRMRWSALVLLAAACGYHPPPITPALLAARGPVRAVPGGAELVVAVRAGSAYDPPGREGLAWVAAQAVAGAAGARVEVSPDAAVFTMAPERGFAFAAALTAPGADRVAEARSRALHALADRSCPGRALRAWVASAWVGHPYGHATEGRTSVLPTLAMDEVQAFLATRYVRDAVVVAGDAGALVGIPPLLSRAVVPTVPSTPAGPPLATIAASGTCVAVGNPHAAPQGIADRAAWALIRAAIGDVASGEGVVAAGAPRAEAVDVGLVAVVEVPGTDPVALGSAAVAGIGRLARAPLADAELARLRGVVAGTASPDVVSDAARAAVLGLPTATEIRASIAGIDASTLQSAAGRLFPPGSVRVVSAGPLAESDAAADVPAATLPESIFR